MTIAERLYQTRTLAARHILQDEAALVGAQGVVSEELEWRLSHEGVTELEAMGEAGNRGRVYYFPSSPEDEGPIFRKEHRIAARLECAAVECPSEELVAAH